MRRRTKYISCVIAPSILLPIVVVCTVDYQRLQFLHDRAAHINQGMTSAQVIGLLGNPDDIAMGSIPTCDGKRIATAVWFYRTNFDWDGIRTRWNDRPFFAYWYSRLVPLREWDVDDVIVLHLAAGKVVVVTEQDRDNGLLFRAR